MMHSPLIKTIWVLFAALFLSAQGLAQAHSVTAGDAEHSHDGVVCEVCLAGIQQITTEPPLTFSTPFNPPVRMDWDVIIINDAPRTFDGRAPPPRGPPTH